MPCDGRLSLLCFSMVIYTLHSGLQSSSPDAWLAGALRCSAKHSLGVLTSDIRRRASCELQPFAPARAFHTDVLIGEMFHAEVSAASAGAGGLMDATHTRVWALLR